MLTLWSFLLCNIAVFILTFFKGSITCFSLIPQHFINDMAITISIILLL